MTYERVFKMSPSETNTNEAIKIMLNRMWLHGAYHLTTLMRELTDEGVAPEVVAKCGLAQLKMHNQGVITRVGPDIYDFTGRVNATAAA